MSSTGDLRTLVRHLEIRSRRLLAGPLSGDYRSALRGRGLEFTALRPYEPGDDPRALDPYASARTGQLHLRLFQEERARTVLLLTDLSASCTAAKRRLLTETTALLAFAAAGHRDRVGLLAFSDRIETRVPPAGGWQHARGLLAALIDCRPAGTGTELAAPLEEAWRILRRPGLVLLLSDFHAPLPQGLLRRLGARHDLAALVLRDGAESAPAGGGLVLLADAESGRRRLVDLTTATSRRRWREAWRTADRDLGRELSALGVDNALLASGEPPLAALRALFRGRGRP